MPNPLRIFKKLIKVSFYNLVQKFDNRTAKVLLIYFQPLYFEMTEREQGKDNILNQNSLTTYIVSQSLVYEICRTFDFSFALPSIETYLLYSSIITGPFLGAFTCFGSIFIWKLFTMFDRFLHESTDFLHPGVEGDVSCVMLLSNMNIPYKQV